MTEAFTCYSLRDGRVLQTGTAYDPLNTQAFEGMGVVLGEYPDAYWYYSLDTEAIQRKQEIVFTINKTVINADGVDRAIVTGLPTDSLITCRGQDYVVSDNKVEFSTDMHGTYILTVSHPRYITLEVVIEALSTT